MDFLPALLLLTAVGILGLEQALADPNLEACFTLGLGPVVGLLGGV